MRGANVFSYGVAICTTWNQLATAVSLDITSDSSIKSAASTISYGLMKYYTGNNTGDNPGNLPDPYYWWEAGAMFGTMVEYWYYTSDTTYNSVVQAALLSQVGEDSDFMPTNQTKTEGNDDQGFWGMAAMSAAEMKFDDPPAGEPGWLALAQGVFNDMASRWDDSTCGGGLRWQIFTFNSGYTYKNAIANGCFFNIAARLAVYTGNQTYADWATKTYDWMDSVGLIGDAYEIYDGSSDTENCTVIDHGRFSYNQGIYLFGAAMMYNYTNASTIWQPRVAGLLNATSAFFSSTKIMYELCEPAQTDHPTGTCDTDQRSFKAYLSRWMAGTAKIAPFTHDTVMSYLRPSAEAAAAQCDGGTDGVTCGEHWTAGSTWDGLYGVGEQMSALSVIQSLLIDEAPALVTNMTGGTSAGNSAAGSGSDDSSAGTITPATSADRAGAGVLTAIMVCGVLGGVGFMISG
ncbi:Six-hairpin glycosidase [Glarea lozoyensis ATCC 20868]|uniref:Mannan endo-1,6-alpha-mannosidase n=1 Tax=Glarea lozoyensis (strain ATCC 20868 / MF5171) TaxID=1116229 RepID=S3DVD6_GLAL2|nr:Six-hairpin glycosidase [Glarea lozoyensis ATCC 20868]EPE35901.1 Six-hairpin glycosidase [Glarea lozoyensis ATCC 20868]